MRKFWNYLFKKENKPEQDIVDELSIILMTHHIYLQTLANLVIDRPPEYEHRTFDKVYIDVNDIEAVIKKKYPSLISDSMLTQTLNYLVADEYLICESFRPVDFVLVAATKKGWAAAMGGEFKLKHGQRQYDLRSLDLTKKSIKAFAHQKFINWALVITALLAGLSPIYVATYLTSTPVIQEPKIRIDSVWLHDAIDVEMKKIKPNRPEQPETTLSRPTGASQ